MDSFCSYLILFMIAFLLPCFILQATLTTGSITQIGQTSRPRKEVKVEPELLGTTLRQSIYQWPFYAQVVAMESIQMKGEAGITYLVHSTNSSMMYSLKGMVGVGYFPENTKEFQHLRRRFCQKFNPDYQEIFDLQEYNVGRNMLEKNFYQWKPNPRTKVEIVYVIGKGYHGVYWTEKLRLARTVKDETYVAITYINSIDNLQQEVLFLMEQWNAYKYSHEDFVRLQTTLEKSQGTHSRKPSYLGFIWNLGENILFGMFSLIRFVVHGLVRLLGFIWYLAITILYGLYLVFHFIFDGLVQVFRYLAKTILYGGFLLSHFIFKGLVQVLGFIWYIPKTILFGLFVPFRFIFSGLAQVFSFILYPAITVLFWLIGKCSEICNVLDNIRTIVGYWKC